VATNKLGGVNWLNTQRSESNSDQYEASDILTIGDSNEDEEQGETDASGRDVCPSLSSRCFLNYKISIIGA